MADFRVVKIEDNIYSILDAGQSSFYLVEGEKLAAVIDTGITMGEQIMPVLRPLTDKPMILVITHAHIDHFHHMDEFETIYMCHDEFKMDEEVLKGMMAGKDLKLHDTIDIQTGDTIDLGGEILEICKVPGHTPGSVCVLAKEADHLFTGDAIGSGSGVWMQVPNAASLEEYRDSLVGLLKWLAERGGRMTFCGGHSYQSFVSAKEPNYNPLSMGLLCDLIDLVDQIIKGKIVGVPNDLMKAFTHEVPLYAAFGRAEMIYLPSRIHRA